MSTKLWKEYGIVSNGNFFFHGGPFGLTWEVNHRTLLQYWMAIKSNFVKPEFLQPILSLKTQGRNEALVRANNKMDSEGIPEQLEFWNGRNFINIIPHLDVYNKEKDNISIMILKNLMWFFYKENPYFADMLLDTGDLKLIYTESKSTEPKEFSIMCPFARSAMYDESQWLKGGNLLGEILMDIREKLKDENV